MRFGPPVRSNALRELTQLQAYRHVDEYCLQFMLFICRCERLSRQQVDIFTAGLLKPLRTDVEPQNPSNLQTAMSFARAYQQPLWDEPDSMPVVTPQATSLHKLHIIFCTSTHPLTSQYFIERRAPA